MSSGLVTAAYIVAAILFIFSLAGLVQAGNRQAGLLFRRSRDGGCLVRYRVSENTHGLGWIIIAMLIGGAIGIYKAKKSRNDRNARADCTSAQLRRFGSRFGRLATAISSRATFRTICTPSIWSKSIWASSSAP